MTTYRAELDGWRSLHDGSFVSTQPPSNELVMIDPTSDPAVQPVGQAGTWALDFSDEFNGNEVDRLKWDPWYPDNEFWNVTVPGGHKSNTNEPQSYDPSAWSISGSVLTFTMRNEELIPGLPYTSGMISSNPSYNTAYGYFESRIRIPQSQGSWPAFWLYPFDHVWPPEIDIMESWGGGHVGQHYIRKDQPVVGTGTDHWAIDAGYHVYGLLWQAGRLVWYVDGTEVFRFEDAGITSKPFQIHVNLAGDKDNPPSVASLPISMDVDYVRVWKEA